MAELLAAHTELVVGAADFRDGIVHCEWIVSGGTPYLVECAGRLPGDGLIGLISRAYPIQLLHAYYALLKGRPLPDLPQRAKGAAAIRFLDAPHGVVTAVHGVGGAPTDVDTGGQVLREQLKTQFGLGVEAQRGGDAHLRADLIVSQVLGRYVEPGPDQRVAPRCAVRGQPVPCRFRFPPGSGSWASCAHRKAGRAAF